MNKRYLISIVFGLLPFGLFFLMYVMISKFDSIIGASVAFVLLLVSVFIGNGLVYYRDERGVEVVEDVITILYNNEGSLDSLSDKEAENLLKTVRSKKEEFNDTLNPNLLFREGPWNANLYLLVDIPSSDRYSDYKYSLQPYSTVSKINAIFVAIATIIVGVLIVNKLTSLSDIFLLLIPLLAILVLNLLSIEYVNFVSKLHERMSDEEISEYIGVDLKERLEELEEDLVDRMVEE